MKTIDLATLRKDLSKVIKDVDELAEEYVITKNGRAIVRIKPVYLPMSGSQTAPDGPVDAQTGKKSSWAERNAAQTFRDELLRGFGRK